MKWPQISFIYQSMYHTNFLEAIASLGVTFSLTDSLTHSQKYKFSPYQSKIYPTFTFSYHDIAGQLDLDGHLDVVVIQI